MSGGSQAQGPKRRRPGTLRKGTGPQVFSRSSPEGAEGVGGNHFSLASTCSVPNPLAITVPAFPGPGRSVVPGTWTFRWPQLRRPIAALHCSTEMLCRSEKHPRWSSRPGKEGGPVPSERGPGRGFFSGSSPEVLKGWGGEPLQPHFDVLCIYSIAVAVPALPRLESPMIPGTWSPSHPLSSPTACSPALQH